MTKRGGRGTAAPAASFAGPGVLHRVDRGHREALVDQDLELGAVGLAQMRLVRAWSASVSTRSTVAPGTLARAAALTLAAVSP